MLENIKEYDCKKKSVINGKIVAKMRAYTDYEETLNLIVAVNEDDYKNNEDEIKDDIRYFIWLSFKDVVDCDIHIERLHSEIPDFIDVDINTTIGVNAPNHREVSEDGMVVDSQATVEDVTEDTVEHVNNQTQSFDGVQDTQDLPDLTDDATEEHVEE